MMKVVGEEGTSTADYITYQKGELLDAAYLQQNSFDAVDAAAPVDRQKDTFAVMHDILMSDYDFEEKNDVRNFFNQLRQAFLDWNGVPQNSPEYKKMKDALIALYKGKVR